MATNIIFRGGPNACHLRWILHPLRELPSNSAPHDQSQKFDDFTPVLNVHDTHLARRVPVAGGEIGRCREVERGNLRLIEHDVHGRDILHQVIAALAARYRHDVFALGEDPGQRDLRRQTSLGRRDLPS